MVKCGVALYLECSSRGDKRFSAFFAKPASLNGISIEAAYQAMKVFPDGSTGLHWRKAKGKRAVNQEDCAQAYFLWWVEYVAENDLLGILKAATGLSDMFGAPGSVCQAEVLWRIRNEMY